MQKRCINFFEDSLKKLQVDLFRHTKRTLLVKARRLRQNKGTKRHIIFEPAFVQV